MKGGHPEYSVHPSVAYAKAIIDNLPEKTGRSLDEWRRKLDAEGPDHVKERRLWLKTKHGLGGTTAARVANASRGESSEDYDAKSYLAKAKKYVEEMYAGKKEHLRPVHDALITLSLKLGPDIRISPCKTMVPIYRNHVFAQIRPSTLTRIDLGLALTGEDPPGRLIDTGGEKRGDRITHRIPVSSMDDIDDEVRQWLSVAYNLDA